MVRYQHNFRSKNELCQIFFSFIIEQEEPFQVYVETMTVDDLKTLQWSEQSLPLSEFVQKYPLPQLVMVEEGFDSAQDENSLSSGQVLKIHSLCTERKLHCLDRHNKEVHLPLHTSEQVYLRPENHDIIYQKVSDLAKAKPAPNFVEVTRGYYDVDSNVNYELSVEPGEILEIVREQGISNLSIKSKKNKSLTFRNKEGVEIKFPYDCVVGFKPLVDNKEHTLADVVASDDISYPFYFEFVNHTGSHGKLGIVKCLSINDDKLIIASCGHDKSQVVFMIPRDLEITVKVAVGTLKKDPVYEGIKSSYHNFKILAEDIKEKRSTRIFRTSSEISGFPFTPVKTKNWESFEEDVFNKNKLNFNGDLILIENTEALNESETNETSNNDLVLIENTETLNMSNGTSDETVVLSNSGKRRSLELAQQQKLFYTGEGNEGLESAINQNGIVAEDLETEKSGGTDSKIAQMTVEELSDNLRGIKMREDLVKEFFDNNIDGELFVYLEEDELKDLGANRFEIKKLKMFKDGWRPKL